MRRYSTYTTTSVVNKLPYSAYKYLCLSSNVSCMHTINYADKHHVRAQELHKSIARLWLDIEILTIS